MTKFEELCEELDSILPIDRDILALLVISIAGKRDVVISCAGIRFAEEYLKALVVNIIGLRPVIIHCMYDTSWKEISSQLSASSKLVIIKDLHVTTKYVQALFLDAMIRKLHVSGNLTTELPQDIRVIVLQSNDRGAFIDPLKDYLLLRHSLTSDFNSALQNALNAVAAANATGLPVSSPALQPSYFEEFRKRAEKITIVPDIRQYIQDTVLFVRNHRLVAKGVSPKASKDLEFLVRLLCVLHDYDFATPSLVAVAARKLFPFRIEICNPKDEPSLKYGGDIKIVTQWMKKWDTELVVEDVINVVPPPL